MGKISGGDERILNILMDMDVLDWKDFNVAMVGATAALAGLVIVAGSVNIERIIKAPSLTSRLGAAISTLVLALVIAAVGLAPGEHLSSSAYGWIIVVGSLAALPFQIAATRRIFEHVGGPRGSKLPKSAIGYLPVVLYLVGGLLIAFGSGAGLTLIALGCLLAIIVGILVSWVVLVEILR